MKPEQQRIAIAEACGLKHPPAGIQGACWIYPDYLNDLNAMHEAEKILQIPAGNCLCGTWWNYRSNLIDICERDSGEQGCEHLNATAAQRAEAFLRTLNLWTS